MSVRRRPEWFKQWNPAVEPTSAHDFRSLKSLGGSTGKRRQSGRSLPTALPALREWTLLSRKCQSTRRLAPDRTGAIKPLAPAQIRQACAPRESQPYTAPTRCLPSGNESAAIPVDACSETRSTEPAIMSQSALMNQVTAGITRRHPPRRRRRPSARDHDP
jgi:hypothetical protein